MAEESDRVVRRIKAKTTEKPKNAPAKTTKTTKTQKKATKTSPKKTKKGESDNYFVGAWRELRQVHWTNRRATWKLTIAVILFSLFFALFILLADWVFNWLIQEVIL
jgi:preprotein translocase SecE subunit